jgi:CRP-like cAMP-binding protein
MSLLKLTPGNYFGDEDGFNSESKMYNAKVISNNCKIYLIPKEKVIFNVKEPDLLQQIYDVSDARKHML